MLDLSVCRHMAQDKHYCRGDSRIRLRDIINDKVLDLPLNISRLVANRYFSEARQVH